MRRPPCSVCASQLDQLLHPVFDTESLKKLVKLTTGIDASPGASVGRALLRRRRRRNVAKSR